MHTGTEATLPPVLDDLSCFIAAGRVTDAQIAIRQAVDAEQLGYRRIWISERYSQKECGVLFGAIAALTSRIGVGSGAMTMGARHPIVTAAIGTTVQSAFGPRCVIGLGKGNVEYSRAHGVQVASYQALIDYATIIKQLYRGETVDYSGPLGTFEGMVMPDLPEGPSPEIWTVHAGGPKACAATANPAFDGAMVGFSSTPEATRESVQMIEDECERIGRDRSTLRICVPVNTAPEFNPSNLEAAAVANPSYGNSPVVGLDQLKCLTALLFTQPSLMSKALTRNGWDPDVGRKIVSHRLFDGIDTADVDNIFRDRAALMDVAELVPDEWIYESCAVGSTDTCVRKLKEFRDAGADEIATYTSAPAQNAEVVAAWHELSATTA